MSKHSLPKVFKALSLALWEVSPSQPDKLHPGLSLFYPVILLQTYGENTSPQRWSWHSWVWNARGNRRIQTAGLTIAFFVTIPPFSQRSKWVLKGQRWNLLCRGIITLEHMEHKHLCTRRNGWVGVKRAVYMQLSQENKNTHKSQEQTQVKAKNWQCCLECWQHQGHTMDKSIPQIQSNNCILQLNLALSLLCQNKKAAGITQCWHQSRTRETRWRCNS